MNAHVTVFDASSNDFPSPNDTDVEIVSASSSLKNPVGETASASLSLGDPGVEIASATVSLDNPGVEIVSASASLHISKDLNKIF